MADKENLTSEWKDAVYNFGGALFGLGKTVCKSVKYGVDTLYDKIYEEEKKENKPSTVKKSEEE